MLRFSHLDVVMLKFRVLNKAVGMSKLICSQQLTDLFLSSRCTNIYRKALVVAHALEGTFKLGNL